MPGSCQKQVEWGVACVPGPGHECACSWHACACVTVVHAVHQGECSPLWAYWAAEW